MPFKLEKEELVERYCSGKLSPEELRIFDQWLESDSDLAEEVRQHRILLDAFGSYASRIELRSRLASIHDEMESDQYRFEPRLTKVDSQSSGLFRIRITGRMKIVAVAALVTIFAVSASILSVNLFGVNGNKSQSAYQELRREVESIKRRQSAIIQTKERGKSADGISAAQPGFTGTGIALNKKGFVLTSHHLVSDAKSIFISNEKYELLKMKLVFSNPELDMAILQVEDEDFNGFSEIPFSIRKSVADPGERVYTLGYPREDIVFGEGSVSSYTGYEGDTTSYQISIPVNPGNSGGPLFDNQGNLLGIISGRNTGAEGASFAIKSRWIANDILESEADGVSIPTSRNLRGLDRSAQVKKIKDFVFMVKVTN